MRWLEKLRKREQVERQAGEEEREGRRTIYQKLVNTAAIDEPLSDADIDRLRSLHNEFSPGEDLVGVVRDFARFIELHRQVRDRNQVQKRLAAAQAAAATFDAATAKIRAQLLARDGERSRTVQPQLDEARQALDAVDAAAMELDQVRRRRWLVLGLPDPAIEEAEQEAAAAASRKKVTVGYRTTAADQPDVRRFDYYVEDLMAQPSANPHNTIDRRMARHILNELTLVPAEGQDDAECAAIQGILQSLVADPREHRFLMPQGVVQGLNYEDRRRFLWFDYYLQAVTTYSNNDPRIYAFIPGPGQSNDELAELVDQVTQAYGKSFPQPAAKDPPTPPRPSVFVEA